MRSPCKVFEAAKSHVLEMETKRPLISVICCIPTLWSRNTSSASCTCLISSNHLFRDMEEFEDVMDEIRNEVTYLGTLSSPSSLCVEPLVIGSSRHPSTAFCILYMLSRRRLTYAQVMSMIHCQVCFSIPCLRLE